MDDLEKRLTSAQWLGGAAPTDEDATKSSELKASGEVPDVLTHPHAFAWFSLVSKFAPAVTATWTAAKPAQAGGKKGKGGGKQKQEPKKAEPKKEEKKVEEDVDEDDLFGDDDDDDQDARMAAKAKAHEAKHGKKVKAEVIAKSLILWEIKPIGEETDLDALAAKILTITKDGLLWKTEYKKEPVAYGIFKLVMGATIEDLKVSTDDVEEEIQAFEDDVQSVDVLSFNKL